MSRVVHRSILISIAVLLAASVMYITLQQKFVPKDEADTGPNSFVHGNTGETRSLASSKSPDEPGESITKSDLEGKGIQAVRNASQRTGLTPEQLQENLQFTFDAFYNPETSTAYKAELHSALTEVIGSDEADFLIAISDMTDWDEIRKAIDEHATATGNNYDQMKLDVGVANGHISSDEIQMLAARGANLPVDISNQLARTGQVDTIIELARSGVITDLNYQDPFTGTNALGTLIQNVGYSPQNYEPEEAARAVRLLINVGIEPKPQNKSFDALDYALQVNPSNAEIKLAIARELLDAGVPFEESHRQLLSRMRESEHKREFYELFANYL